MWCNYYKNSITMDRLLRAEIVNEVKRAAQEALAVANERWLSADELCEQFAMFTPSWLKTYGKLLPRQQAQVTDGDKVTSSRWAYPQHKIARMIADNSIKDLRIENN